jgi:outer membrane protein OmpA-like peptidoglycan-associated protein
MIKNILVVTLVFVSVVSFSQTNLVPNSTFEKIGKKIKTVGEISVAEPWVSPTLAPADLYVEKTKNSSISIPDNAHGAEKPMKGSGYAGIFAYSYKNKIARSYLQVKLTEKLKAGKEYCVRYHVSLSDLSKYATNHLGVAITKEAVSANNSDILKVESSIESRKLTVYEKQFYWTPICGVFKAEGGEEFLTIGNFTEDDKLETKKVKRPKGFSSPQVNDAYYYIDNVSVIDVASSKKKCDCDVTPGMENVETVRSDFSSDMSVNTTTVKIINSDGSTGGVSSSDAVLEEKVDGMKIMFDEGKSSVDASLSKLDKVVAYLKENIDERIKISGYIDESEKTVEKLAGKRVGAVYKYLVSKGVSKTRIERNIGGSDSPVDKKDVKKNMRLEIDVLPM